MLKKEARNYHKNQGIQKTVILLVLVLILPFSYMQLYLAFLMIAYLGLSVMNLWMDVNEWIITADIDYFFAQSMFSLFALAVYGVFYFRIHKLRAIEGEIPHQKTKKEKIAINIIIYAAIALGINGISRIWILFVENVLYPRNLFGFRQIFDNYNATGTWNGQGSLFWLVCFMIFLMPLVEELLFRGLQYYCAEKVAGGYFAVAVTAISYGIWQQEPIKAVYAAMAGLILGIVFYKTKSLPAVYWIHFVSHLTWLIRPYLPDQNIASGLNVAFLVMIVPAVFLLVRMPKSISYPGGGREVQIQTENNGN